MDDHACVNVFGHGLGPEPADFHQHTTAKQPAAAFKKRAVMPIASGLKDTIEQRLLILENAFELKVLLKDIWVIKMMRRLNERDLFILEKAHRVSQETGAWNMVDIKNGDDFACRVLQGMVEIS